MSRTPYRMVGTVAAVLLLAGCQGDQEPTGSPTPTPTGTTATPTGPSASSEEPATATSTEGETGTGTGGETSTGPATSDGPTGEATETDVPSSLPPWTSGVSEGDPGQAGEPQEITGVRTGVHEDYDRVVLDLTGDEPTLGWGAQFIAEAVDDPSGRPLDVEGDHFLQVGIRGIDWTSDSPDRYDGSTVQGAGTQVVTEVAFGGLFEGQQQIVIGLREEAEYRIFSLSDPARIVIDVRHR